MIGHNGIVETIMYEGYLALNPGCVSHGICSLRQMTDSPLDLFLLLFQRMDLNSAAVTLLSLYNSVSEALVCNFPLSILCVLLLSPLSSKWLTPLAGGSSVKRLTWLIWKNMFILLKHRFLTVLVIWISELLILHFYQASNI